MARQAAVSAILAAALCGCAAGPGVTSPEAVLPADGDSAAFLDRVSAQVNVSQNDAARGILMLLEGQDACKTFGERIDRLKGRGVVPAGWTFAADRPVTKGRVAYMIHQACRAPRGVVLTLTGPSQRYCLRELQYLGMMSQGFPTTTVTGMEFVAVLTRAEEYRRTGKLPEVMSGRQEN